MMLPQITRLKYELWLRDLSLITRMLQEDKDFKDSEDLGDYVETIGTLLTFAPRAPIHHEGYPERWLTYNVDLEETNPLQGS